MNNNYTLLLEKYLNYYMQGDLFYHPRTGCYVFRTNANRQAFADFLAKHLNSLYFRPFLTVFDSLDAVREFSFTLKCNSRPFILPQQHTYIL